MGTDPGTNQKEDSPQHQDSGDLVADDHMAVVADYGNQAANVATSSTETDPVAFEDGNVIGTEGTGTGDLPGDDDLLGALTSMPSIAMSNIDHTLDQLSHSTDLFDVPALDFYDDLPT
jgi:hypothetical protein